MIKYKAAQTRFGDFSVEVFNGVESGGSLIAVWQKLDYLMHDMELLGIEPVFPPDVT